MRFLNCFTYRQCSFSKWNHSCSIIKLLMFIGLLSYGINFCRKRSRTWSFIQLSHEMNPQSWEIRVHGEGVWTKKRTKWTDLFGVWQQIQKWRHSGTLVTAQCGQACRHFERHCKNLWRFRDQYKQRSPFLSKISLFIDKIKNCRPNGKWKALFETNAVFASVYHIDVIFEKEATEQDDRN